MTAIEHVEKLKVNRRAEIAALEAEVERAAHEREEKKRAAWIEGVPSALAELGETWLNTFRAPDKDREPFGANGNRTYREAAFAVPGHRTVFMRVEDISYHNDFKWRAWPIENNNWMATWAVVSGSASQGYPTLADALIAAELQLGETDE